MLLHESSLCSTISLPMPFHRSIQWQKHTILNTLWIPLPKGREEEKNYHMKSLRLKLFRDISWKTVASWVLCTCTVGNNKMGTHLHSSLLSAMKRKSLEPTFKWSRRLSHLEDLHVQLFTLPSQLCVHLFELKSGALGPYSYLDKRFWWKYSLALTLISLTMFKCLSVCMTIQSCPSCNMLRNIQASKVFVINLCPENVSQTIQTTFSYVLVSLIENRQKQNISRPKPITIKCN